MENLTPQEKYNRNIITGLIQEYKDKGAKDVRLLKYYEVRKWGVYMFEHVLDVKEKDQFGNHLRTVTKNFYSTVEIKPDGRRTDTESRKDSRRIAENAYDGVVHTIEDMISKGRL